MCAPNQITHRSAAAAYIVISLDAKGCVLTTSSVCFDSPDSSHRPEDDATLLRSDLPFLLAELRQQLALGRRLTLEESEPLNQQRRQSKWAGQQPTTQGV